VAGLTRVEGAGALYVRVGSGRVAENRLDICEPPRFFEAFLRGRSYTVPPGHHRPGLRNLPGYLADKCMSGHRGRLRGPG